MFNRLPLNINTKDYVKAGKDGKLILVEYSTNLCDTWEEANQLRAFVARLRGVSTKSIDIERYASNTKHIQEKPMSKALNSHLAKQKTFSGKGLSLNTIEIPAKYKKGTYQGKSDNNLLSVPVNGEMQRLINLETGVRKVRVVDKSGIADYARSMQNGEFSRSVYFAESAERNKGKSIIFDGPQYKERNGFVQQSIEHLRVGGYLTLDTALVESLRKSGMQPREMRTYLKERNFSQRQAQKIMAQL